MISGISETDDALLRGERLDSDLQALHTGEWCLQFEHGDLFRMRAHHTNNADGNRLRAKPVDNLNGRPFLVRKVHGRSHMSRGHHRGGGEEPSGATYAKHAGIELAFLIVEVPRDAHRRTNERGRINAGRLDARAER